MSSYKDHYASLGTGRGQGRGRGWEMMTVVCTHSWADFTHDRLTWLYGAERANAIRAGRDPETNADLAAWNALGNRRAA